MKAKLLLLTCFFGSLAISKITAQVTASFSMDNSTGCSPLSVNFTNLSSGSGTLSYIWDLGNGNTAILKDPKAIYTTPGTYKVKLTVSNGTESNSIEKDIIVYKNPVANFTALQKACVPIDIQFTDTSTPGDGSITDWNWDFRNGTIKTEQNPLISYASPGKYDIFLEVTDANGCKSNVDKNDFIDLVEKPVVSFVATPPSSCTIPASIQFTNKSTGGGNLSYNWDFGSGSTSSMENPNHNYTTYGTFNVKLQVTSDYGCSASLDIPAVIIGKVTAAGSLKQGTTTIVDNSIICAGEIDYANLSAGNPNCFWDFGDGFFSYSSSGKHPYATAGNYTVKLVAGPGDVCADTTQWNITVEKATAAFTMVPEQSCSNITSVGFTNQSSDAVSYTWTFDDGTTSTQENLVHVYTIPKDKDAYVIHEDYSFPVTLTATSQHGCKASIQKYFNVQQPTALFSASVVNGCTPLTVNFTDQSVSNDQITTREWLFGEGSPQSTTSSVIQHIYTSEGSYPARLVTHTISGCADTSYFVTIKVGKSITPDFSVNNTSVCNSGTIQFTDQSPAGNINRWHYSINGKGVPGCPDISNPLFKLRMDTGALSVKLTVENNGCYSEVTKNNMIQNIGPLGDFSYSNNCTAIRTVNFQATAKGAISFKWDFGDSQTNTTDLNITHAYTSEGNYLVKLITINGSCSDTVSRMVKVRDRQAAFSFKPEACADENIYFNSKTSHKLSDACDEKYLWDFGDSSQRIRSNNDSVSHSFKKGGTFQVKLLAFYDDGCLDSITNAIRIYQPAVGFTTDKSVGCAPLPVLFTDISTPDVHPIIFWDWAFGDGHDTSYTIKKNTLNYVFGYPGDYITTLNVSDDFGCKASFDYKIGTAIPTADFIASTPRQVCAGSDVGFSFSYYNPDSAIWNLGNGHILRSIANPTSFNYKDTGNFAVTLTIYKYGCSDQLTYNNYVQVQKADARFSASDTVYNCYPKLITFTHLAGTANVQSGKWFYGQDNNTSPGYVKQTSYNYTQPGTYLAKLFIQTSFGCTDTFNRSIKITGPVGFFEVTPKQACKGDDVTLTLTDTSNVYSYEWDLGDGNFSTVNPVIHKYYNVGNKTAKLILYGDNGKCIPPPVEQSIYVYEVIAGFTVADTSVCEGTDILFQNTSIGANDYAWDFGDGTNSSSESPSHQLATGTFNIGLIVTNTQGCKDTAFHTILVNKLPLLTLNKDTTICLGGTASLKALSNSNAIRWEPYQDLSSANSFTPLATPKQTVIYNAIAIDTVSRCEKRDSVLISVQQIPQIQLSVEDSSIIAGRPIQLLVTSEDNAGYSWTPAELLSCPDCNNPITTPRATTDYLLMVTDKNHCFTVKKKFTITVEEGTKAFDLPTAFTPGGTEKNTIFKVAGFNIKQLLEFNIYNRWGNLVFSSTDLSKGWDGTYQGKAQPTDTYVYSIKIETYDGKIESKTGTVLLLR